MENTYMLTTFDNPYNPFVDFASWYMFDCEHDHNTSGRLARLSNVDNEMTEKEVGKTSKLVSIALQKANNKHTQKYAHKFN